MISRCKGCHKIASLFLYLHDVTMSSLVLSPFMIIWWSLNHMILAYFIHPWDLMKNPYHKVVDLVPLPAFKPFWTHWTDITSGTCILLCPIGNYHASSSSSPCSPFSFYDLMTKAISQHHEPSKISSRSYGKIAFVASNAKIFSFMTTWHKGCRNIKAHQNILCGHTKRGLS